MSLLDTRGNTEDPVSAPPAKPQHLPISERPPVPGAASDPHRPREETLRHIDGEARRMQDLKKMAATASTMGCLPTVEERDRGPEGSDSVTPPYARWAESLRGLLADPDGAALFRRFVTQENQQSTLMFYFAVEGFRKDRPSEERSELAKIINRRFVKANGESRVEVSPGARTGVAEAIRRVDIGADLFDAAQREVERVITETSYPMFLKSDLYVQYVSNGGISPESTESTSSSASHVPVGYLPTLPEDSEYYVPPQREDDDRPNKQQPLPLTREMLIATTCQRSKVGKHVQEGKYQIRPCVKSRLNPYHPIPVGYAAFAPAVSTNDSERQSISSDAISDDTMSLTDSSIDGLLPISKPQKRRRIRAMKQNAHCNGRLSNFPDMPKTQRAPRDSTPQCPDEFASILISKLKPLENDQIANDKLNARLRKVEEDDLDVMKPSVPSTKDTEPLISAAGFHEEDPNSILEEHVLRVFKDSAKHSPSGRSPRSRSPERAHRSAKASSQNAPAQLLLPQQKMSSTHRSQQRHRTKDKESGGVGGVPAHLLTEMPVDPTPTTHHYHHHYRQHHSWNRRSSGCQDAAQQHGVVGNPGYIHYAKVYPPIDGVGGGGFSPYTSEIVVDPSPPPLPPQKHKSGGGSGSKKSSKKSDVSCTTKTTDSGIFEGHPYLPSDGEVNRNKRIKDWLENSNTKTQHKRSATRKANSYATSRSCGSSQDRPRTPPNYGGAYYAQVVYAHNKSSHLPGQPFMQDPSMPLMHPPEPIAVLEEARRRIDISSKLKISSGVGSSKKDRAASSSATSTLTRSGQTTCKTAPSAAEDDHGGAKAGKKSASTSSSGRPMGAAADKETTTVAYFLSPDPIPYRTTLPGKDITLRQFKTLINKRGMYRYTFKMQSEEFQSGVVHEIVSNDDAVLPVYQDKIVGKVEKVDCPETTM